MLYQHKKYNEYFLQSQKIQRKTGSVQQKMHRAYFCPSHIHTTIPKSSVDMYYFQPILLAKCNIAKLYFCHFFNVICDGSPSRIRRVLLISLGMTTRPRSSMRRTIPVAFIPIISLAVHNLAKILHDYCMNSRRRYAQIMVFAKIGTTAVAAIRACVPRRSVCA